MEYKILYIIHYSIATKKHNPVGPSHGRSVKGMAKDIPDRLDVFVLLEKGIIFVYVVLKTVKLINQFQFTGGILCKDQYAWSDLRRLQDT